MYLFHESQLSIIHAETLTEIQSNNLVFISHQLSNERPTRPKCSSMQKVWINGFQIEWNSAIYRQGKALVFVYGVLSTTQLYWSLAALMFVCLIKEGVLINLSYLAWLSGCPRLQSDLVLYLLSASCQSVLRWSHSLVPFTQAMWVSARLRSGEYTLTSFMSGHLVYTQLFKLSNTHIQLL